MECETHHAHGIIDVYGPGAQKLGVDRYITNDSPLLHHGYGLAIRSQQVLQDMAVVFT